MNFKLSYNRTRILIRVSSLETIRIKDLTDAAESIGLRYDVSDIITSYIKMGLVKRLKHGVYELTEDAYRAVIEIEKDIDYANSSN